jgi:hypothetical protein
VIGTFVARSRLILPEVRKRLCRCLESSALLIGWSVGWVCSKAIWIPWPSLMSALSVNFRASIFCRWQSYRFPSGEKFEDSPSEVLAHLLIDMMAALSVTSRYIDRYLLPGMSAGFRLRVRSDLLFP